MSTLPDSVLQNLEPGKTFIDRAFMSTSKTDPFAGKFQFEIHSKSGRDIGSLSEHPNEAEVIFRPGTEFRIDSISVKNGVTYVTMTEK